MYRILFVCYGNICRSPMAEFCMKDMVKKAGRENDFLISSAATSRDEIGPSGGNPVYPPARKKLAEHGIDCAGKRARQITKEDYGSYDAIICMEKMNVRDAMKILGSDPDGKVRLLLPSRDIADPWFTGDFEKSWRDIEEGCRKLLEESARFYEKVSP